MLQTVRFPYVRFTTEVVERKDAQGHTVFLSVDYANITPAGGKDEVVKVADEWISELREKAMTRGPFDLNAAEYMKWHEHFKKNLDVYRQGNELSVSGTPLRACPAFSKVEVAQAEAVKIFSVEELAACNEEAIGRMGMIGRQIKLKAQKYLEDKQSGGLAQENEALRVRMQELEDKVAQMLKAGIAEPEKRGPGRPKAKAEE